MFESIKVGPGKSKATLTCFDLELRSSSTLEFIQNSFAIRNFLNTAANKVAEMRDLTISDAHWNKAKIVQEFLQTAASVTNAQSGPLYVLIRVFFLAFQSLMKRFSGVRSSQVSDLAVSLPFDTNANHNGNFAHPYLEL